MSLGRTFATAAAVTLLLSSTAMAQWQPQRPVEFIVASGAGGGTDNFARTVQSIITKHELMDQPVVVLNKGGGSGAEAFLYAKANAGDPHKVIFGTNNVYLLPLVAKLAYTTEDLEPIAALAFDEFLIWVNADSEYQDAASFIEAAKAEPGSIRFAGSQSKDTDETLVKLLEDATGAKFTYVPFNGGGEVSVQLAGGHVDANVNNPNENIGQWEAGAIRPLCVFSDERMAEGPKVSGEMGWSDIPLCSDSGIPIESYQMPRTIWAPAGLPGEARAFYEDLFQKVSETPEWQEYVARTSQTGRFLAGDELKSFIAKNKDDTAKVFEQEGWIVQ
jgi:tripartite-type tricarboxylate transporter receptor subunit TctC